MRLSVTLYALFTLWACSMHSHPTRDFEIGHNSVPPLLYGDHEVFFDNKNVHLALVSEGVKGEIISKTEAVSGWQTHRVVYRVIRGAWLQTPLLGSCALLPAVESLQRIQRGTVHGVFHRGGSLPMAGTMEEEPWNWACRMGGVGAGALSLGTFVDQSKGSRGHSFSSLRSSEEGRVKAACFPLMRSKSSKGHLTLWWLHSHWALASPGSLFSQRSSYFEAGSSWAIFSLWSHPQVTVSPPKATIPTFVMMSPSFLGPAQSWSSIIRIIHRHKRLYMSNTNDSWM